jgi:hypothetical protein
MHALAFLFVGTQSETCSCMHASSNRKRIGRMRAVLHEGTLFSWMAEQSKEGRGLKQKIRMAANTIGIRNGYLTATDCEYNAVRRMACVQGTKRSNADDRNKDHTRIPKRCRGAVCQTSSSRPEDVYTSTQPRKTSSHAATARIDTSPSHTADMKDEGALNSITRTRQNEWGRDMIPALGGGKLAFTTCTIAIAVSTAQESRVDGARIAAVLCYKTRKVAAVSETSTRSWTMFAAGSTRNNSRDSQDHRASFSVKLLYQAAETRLQVMLRRCSCEAGHGEAPEPQNLN